MLKETLHFLFFIFILALISYSLTAFRIKDKAYIYSESGISEDDLKVLNKKKDFWNGFSNYLISIPQFSFGKTESGEDVTSHIKSRLIPSLHLAFFSVFWGGFLGIFIGLYSLYLNRQWFSSLFFGISELILSTPIFVFAVLLLIIFFLKFPVLPPGGYKPYQISYLILPGVSLGSRVFARIFYYTYLEGKKEEETYYTFFLKSKGFSKSRIVFNHTFRKIFPLLLVFLLLDFSSLLSGAIIIEDIFLFPGIGKSLYYAIKRMDENLLRALLFYSGIIFYSFTRLARVIQSKLSASI